MDKYNILMEAAKITYGDIGDWTYYTWTQLNNKYFDGCLAVGAINYAITPYAKSLGYYVYDCNKIILHKSLIPSNGYKFCEDVLLHEMIHQKIHQTYSKEEISQAESGSRMSSHNNILWVKEICRIADII